MTDKKTSKFQVLDKSTRVESNMWLVPRDRGMFYLTHDFHPYFAAFPPQIPRKVMEIYSKEGDIILDPFQGGGSTIVEAYLTKRQPWGSDISELARLITKVKVTPLNIDMDLIKETLHRISADVAEFKFRAYEGFKYPIPKVTNIDFWFTKEAKLDLAIVLHHINYINDNDLRDFFKIAFSSIVRKVSYGTNAESHLRREREKQIPSVIKLFSGKIMLMCEQMDQYIKLLTPEHYRIKPVLETLDVRKLTTRFDEGTVDLIITSPPYGTGSRYTDIYRMSFEWLSLPKPSRRETLETSTANFVHELALGIEQMYRILKTKGYCVLVYGDPSTKGITHQTIDEAKRTGFKYEGYISCPIVKMSSKHHVKYRQYIPKDFVLIFKKS